MKLEAPYTLYHVHRRTNEQVPFATRGAMSKHDAEQAALELRIGIGRGMAHPHPDWTIAALPMKSPVTAVRFDRVEGPAKECVSVLFVVRDAVLSDDPKADKTITVPRADLRDAVLHCLRDWGRTAPRPGHAYDKVRFAVMWENDERYDGRFDMQKGGTDCGETFWQSLSGRLNCFACRQRPAHFKDDDWTDYCRVMEDNGAKQTCGRILDTCEVEL